MLFSAPWFVVTCNGSLGGYGPVSGVRANRQASAIWEAAVGGPECHAGDMGNPGEVHRLEAVGGKLAVNITSRFSSQASCLALLCTPSHVLSCPSQGVILPIWEVIPHKVSVGYDWYLNPVTLTRSRPSTGRWPAFRNTLLTESTDAKSHKVSHEAVFL